MLGLGSAAVLEPPAPAGRDGACIRMDGRARPARPWFLLALSGARPDGLRLLVCQLLRSRDRLARRALSPGARRKDGCLRTGCEHPGRARYRGNSNDSDQSCLLSFGRCWMSAVSYQLTLVLRNFERRRVPNVVEGRLFRLRNSVERAFRLASTSSPLWGFKAPPQKFARWPRP